MYPRTRVLPVTCVKPVNMYIPHCKKSVRNSWIFSQNIQKREKTYADKGFFVAKLIIQPLNENLIPGLKEFVKGSVK